MSEVPLIAARGLRVDVDGAALLEGATFATRGGSVALVGDGYALLRAIAGSAEVRAGELSVLGLDVGRREQLGTGTVGIALFDPPLPPKWTAREYLAWGARLSGAGATAARESAASTLADLGLDKLAEAKTAALSPSERRALILAQAIVTRPAVLVAENPLSGLSGHEGHYVAAVLDAATKGRKWIVSLSNLYAGSEENVFAAQADELLVFASGKLVRQGKLQKIEEGTVGYTLLLRGGVVEFREALRARGVALSGGPQRFFVELPPDMKARDLVALSAEVGAPLVELVPRILLS